MPDILQSKERKARKEHVCNYCNGRINKGEIYDWASLKNNGDLYEWKNHIDCGFIAQQLWQYIDPDDGLTEEDFQEGCREFCKEFCCPGCPKCNTEEYEDLECNDDLVYCLDKIVDKLRTHDFKKVKKDGDWMPVWRCYPKEAENI